MLCSRNLELWKCEKKVKMRKTEICFFFNSLPVTRKVVMWPCTSSRRRKPKGKAVSCSKLALWIALSSKDSPAWFILSVWLPLIREQIIWQTENRWWSKGRTRGNVSVKSLKSKSEKNKLAKTLELRNFHGWATSLSGNPSKGCNCCVIGCSSGNCCALNWTPKRVSSRFNQKTKIFVLEIKEILKVATYRQLYQKSSWQWEAVHLRNVHRFRK